ncbi:2-octaprenylphenol hydroxylase [Dehalobacter sp. MCB1]|nr:MULTISPECIES: AarF/UbiB family protein [unclassified Dehalobacter]RJE46687.1 2-octaprenylphenol hydroxylase [Dehalobacter sp. MCB1]TCX47454.1 2-octaprenylphenol hydroxylase [Dehalobacter sp. 14DCB1]TCX55667.1 2-octaprenylphenol hydroxylase [Dehalobacter sp. 12DCB1]
MHYKRIHARRYREIIAVFTKHGFGLMLERFGLRYPLKIKGKVSDAGTTPDIAGTSAGKRLKLALEELGPAFVKLGQILSIRRDILPADITEELKKLQDSVQPFPFSRVKALIEAEFDDNLENIYKEFDEQPVASASISQVHRARLVSGKQVAVKVQRPDIEDIIHLDLDILKNLAHFVDHRTKYGELYDFSGMVAEFEKTIQNELDFTKEGENADTFLRNFSQDEGVAVPKIRWIYTTKRVLTMEYVEGIKISDSDALDQAGIDRGELAERLAASICNQVLRDGFFHADPHPGNIQVLTDGTIIFLDLGMVGRLSGTRKEMISHFFIGVASKDTGLVVSSILDMDAMPDRRNVKNFERGIGAIIEKYLTMPMSGIKIDELLQEVFQTAFSNHVKIPREFALLAKTLGTLQGLLEKLAPDLNSFVVAEPIAKKLIYQSFSADKVKSQIKKNLLNYGNLLTEFPVAMRNLLRKAEDEDFTVPFEMKEMDDLKKRLERIFNRISFSVILLAVSIIIAGVLISSGLSANTSGEMVVFNITVLKTGLAFAAVIVLGLVISMFRSRR